VRVTSERKQATRERLLRVAGELFRDRGFAATTTRHIAKKARLASGTMFNYFPSKEELALALVVELLQAAHVEFSATRRLAGTLDEWMFALITTELRHLSPTRTYLRDILDGVLHPAAGEHSSAAAVRRTHLRRVREILSDSGISSQAGNSGWEHLYWSLYLGVLTHWSTDSTPNQEASMALLDRANGMFLNLVRFWPADSRGLTPT
jgi:AcrR family transcriptional regulator